MQGPPKAHAAASASVTISDFQFAPSPVTVNVGETVSWTNQGPSAHSATATGGSFDTGIFSKGGTRSATFNTAGHVLYICTPHPFMKGTVIVQAASTGGGDDSGSGSSTSGTDTSGTSGTTSGTTSTGPQLANTGMGRGRAGHTGGADVPPRRGGSPPLGRRGPRARRAQRLVSTLPKDPGGGGQARTRRSRPRARRSSPGRCVTPAWR